MQIPPPIIHLLIHTTTIQIKMITPHFLRFHHHIFHIYNNPLSKLSQLLLHPLIYIVVLFEMNTQHFLPSSNLQLMQMSKKIVRKLYGRVINICWQSQMLHLSDYSLLHYKNGSKTGSTSFFCLFRRRSPCSYARHQRRVLSRWKGWNSSLWAQCVAY